MTTIIILCVGEKLAHKIPNTFAQEHATIETPPIQAWMKAYLKCFYFLK